MPSTILAGPEHPQAAHSQPEVNHEKPKPGRKNHNPGEKYLSAGLYTGAASGGPAEAHANSSPDWDFPAWARTSMHVLHRTILKKGRGKWWVV